MFFLKSRIGHYSKSSWTKLSFFPDCPWNSVWKSATTYFFWTTHQGFRRGQSRKSDDFDQYTKKGLKSSVLGFIIRETAQKDHNKNLYMIERWKKFYGLNLSGQGKLCDHLAMVTWEFFVGMVPGRNLPYGFFLFSYDICVF